MVNTLPVVVVVPMHDADGVQIDVDRWSARFSVVLEELCTTAAEQQLTASGVVLVRARVDRISLLRRGSLDALRDELTRFGREAHPSEVGVVVGDTYFGISSHPVEPHP